MRSAKSLSIILSEGQLGTVHSLNVSSLDSILGLKRLISLKTQVPSYDIVLYLRGNILQDDYFLKDLNLPETESLLWTDRRNLPVFSSM